MANSKATHNRSHSQENTPQLDESKLGEIEGRDQSKNYTHIKWADKAHKLWSALTDPDGHLLDQIRLNLPKALLDTMTLTTRNNGTKFFEVVQMIDVERMMQRVSKRKAMQELEEHMSVLLSPTPYVNHPAFQSSQPTHPPNYYYQPVYYPQTLALQPTYTPPQCCAQENPAPQMPVR